MERRRNLQEVRVAAVAVDDELEPVQAVLEGHLVATHAVLVRPAVLRVADLRGRDP